MSKVKFTEEQQQELRNNKYTAKVTANSLSFTKEFKELFHNEYLTGVLPREILRRYGYPVEILGKQRIWGIAHCIKKERKLPFLPPGKGFVGPGGRCLLAGSQGSALSPRRANKNSQLKEYHKECLILRVPISYPSTLLGLQKKHVYQVGYT